MVKNTVMHPEKKESPPDESDSRGDWIDVLRNHIAREVRAHNSLGFYGVVLQRGGKGTSVMVGHQELPVQHLFDHVLTCLNEDIAYEEMK